MHKGCIAYNTTQKSNTATNNIRNVVGNIPEYQEVDL